VGESDLELERLLERAGVQRSIAKPLARYGAFVLEANRSLNLTGAKTSAELADHLLDSLSVVPFVSGRYIDVGSGAGFPGVPVAIASALPVTFVEATAKKARFLESVLETFGLGGTVVAERAETAAHRLELRERFACATARAVNSAPAVAELVLPFLEVGGAAILQRGAFSVEERRSLEDACLVLGGELESERKLGEMRRIILVRKVRRTSARFPRRVGVPAKRPLCSP